MLYHVVLTRRLINALTAGDIITMVGNATDQAIIHALNHRVISKPIVPRLRNVTIPETKHDIMPEIKNWNKSVS